MTDKPRYNVTLKVKTDTEGWITIETVGGEFKAGGLVEAKGSGFEAVKAEGLRIANRWAETRGGIVHYFRAIRLERSFETFSRGLEVVQAIRKMWAENEKITYVPYRMGPPRGVQINANIEALCEEFDLNLDEWHYWAEITMEALLTVA